MKWAVVRLSLGLLGVALALFLLWPRAEQAAKPASTEALDDSAPGALAPSVELNPLAPPPSHRPLPFQRRAAAPPTLPKPPPGLTVDKLAELDPIAFSEIMTGLSGNRPAIRDCVLKLQKDVNQPLVLEWNLVLDVQVENQTARITEASSDQWPEALSDEMRQCFTTAFSDYQFDTDQAFAYRFLYPMQLSVAPPSG